MIIKLKKFRAWDRQNKKMLSGSEFMQKDLYLTLDGGIMCVNPVGNRYAIAEESYPIMECLKLIDKNGKEVYDGDIIHIIAYDHVEGHGKVKVREFEDQVYYNEEMAGYMPFVDGTSPVDNDSDWGEFWIVGNIYENPELLQVNNQ